MSDPIETSLGSLQANHFWPRSLTHRVFCGPKFLYALFNPDDEVHDVARGFMTFLRDGELPYRQLMLNEHVIDETATRLKKRCSLQHAAAFLDTLDRSELYCVEYTSPSVFVDARDTFLDWTDHGGSFTDHVVAAHMVDLDVDHLLTFDSHYRAFPITPLPYLT